MIHLTPKTGYNGATITEAKWRDADGAASRNIRTDVTLDNQVAITDSGFSWGNSAMRISIPYNPTRHELLTSWLRAWPELIISRPDGLWHGVLKKITPRGGEITLDVAIVERLSP